MRRGTVVVGVFLALIFASGAEAVGSTMFHTM